MNGEINSDRIWTQYASKYKNNTMSSVRYCTGTIPSYHWFFSISSLYGVDKWGVLDNDGTFGSVVTLGTASSGGLQFEEKTLVTGAEDGCWIMLDVVPVIFKGIWSPETLALTFCR